MSSSAVSSLSDSPDILRSLVRLALPVLVEQLLGMAVGLENRWLAGNYLSGDQYLAAMNQVGYLLWFVSSLFAAISIGAMALVARFVGAGDWHLARRTTYQALTLGVGIVALLVVIALAVGRQFLGVLGLEQEAMALAERYLTIMLCVTPAIMLEQVGIACLHGTADTVSGLVAMTAMNVVNVVLSTSLVLACREQPQMAWDGLAIGMAAGHIVAGLVILQRLAVSRLGLRLDWQQFRPDGGMIRRLLRIGLPGGADVLALVGCQLWFVAIVNGLGTVAAAAHGVGVTIESASFLAGSAFQVAVATLTGQYLGAGEPQRASRAVFLGCLTGGGLVCAGGLVLYFGSEALAHFFVASQSNVAERTALLLRIMAFNQPFLALFLIISGALRGAGDTRWPLVFTLAGFLLVRIPLAYWLAWPGIELTLLGVTVPGLGMGIRGAWYAMAIDVVVRCLLVCWRFQHGGWKLVKV